MPFDAPPSAINALLTHFVTALWEAPQEAALVPPLMIWGPPGVGKSAVVRQVAKTLGIGLVDIRLAQREPVDMRGLPVPDADGNAVRWLVASEWPREPESRGIIFFDELTAADRTLQAAAYEMILDRRLGDLYRVPNGWYIAAAGNRAADRAVSTPMSSALANRFCHVTMGADAQGWLKWGRSAGLHPAVLGFIAWRPNLLFDLGADCQQGWPSPRSWERVSYVLQLADRRGRTGALDFLNLQISGLIGSGAAIEFLAFLQQSLNGPSAEDILIGGADVVIPLRADQRFALASALAHVMRAQGPAIHGLWPRFLNVTQLMTSDFAAMAVSEVLESQPTDQLELLMAAPAMTRWSLRHGPALALRRAADDPFDKHLDLDALIAQTA